MVLFYPHIFPLLDHKFALFGQVWYNWTRSWLIMTTQTYVYPPLEPQLITGGDVFDCRTLPDLSLQSFLDCYNKLISKTIIIKNLQFLYPIIDTVLLNLAVLTEINPKNIIFTTTFNPYFERIYNRVKTLPLILDNVIFKPLTIIPDLRQTEIIWFSLSEIQRRLLRQIMSGEKNFPAEFKPDLDYLTQTGINLPLLNQVLLKNNILTDDDLLNLFFGKDKIVLKKLLENKNNVISRDDLGALIWPNGDYSDWALDKFVQRLRKKLLKLAIDPNNLKTVKRQGFGYFNSAKFKSLTVEKFNGLKFEQLVADKETISYYKQTFTNPSLRKILYTTTPRTEKEITDWLKELLNKDGVKYFTIKNKNKTIGHVGLADPDWQSHSIRLGCFLGNPKNWLFYGQTIFKFIVNKSKDLDWKLLYCDVAGEEPTQIKLLESLGFKRNNNRPSILNLKL
ncbi:MAG: helix-turn-helix domain-containing protein [bacterium]|nr:helix-turn-helix domain-containing protein [bacterium]